MPGRGWKWKSHDCEKPHNLFLSWNFSVSATYWWVRSSAQLPAEGRRAGRWHAQKLSLGLRDSSVCLAPSILPPTQPAIHSHSLWCQQMLQWVTACFPLWRSSSVNEGMWGALLAQRSLVADGDKTQLEAERSADVTYSIHKWHLPQRRGWDLVKAGRISGLFVRFWEWRQTPWLRAWQDCGTENSLPLAPSVLDSDTAPGTAPHSLQSLTDLGRKMKVKNIHAIHEFPRKSVLKRFSCSIERKGVRRYQNQSI